MVPTSTSKPPAGAGNHQPFDLNRSAVARYIQLATLFRSRIEQGVWKAGQQIPTVDDLAAEFGVARATIRQALDQLGGDGLIDRYRAKGTFVRSNQAERLWCEVETDWSGLLRARDGAKIEILSNRSGQDGASLRATIGVAAPLYQHVRRRHWRDGQPFLLADVYLDQRLSAKLGKRDWQSKTALRLVANLPGVQIVQAQQTLTIGMADVEAAAALQIPLNAPVAHVHRAAVDAEGVVILVANGIYRGDVVRVDIKLR